MAIVLIVLTTVPTFRPFFELTTLPHWLWFASIAVMLVAAGCEWGRQKADRLAKLNVNGHNGGDLATVANPSRRFCMRAIIVGCGRVGTRLAQLLEQEAHQVVIVDRNPAAFDRLHAGFAGQCVVGTGFDRDTLREAGIERADAFAAVTSGDNSNFVAATVARDTFRVPTVIARIYDPQREQIYRRLGIRTISPTDWGAHKIKRLLVASALRSQYELGNGEVELIAGRISTLLAGRSVRDISSGGRGDGLFDRACGTRIRADNGDAARRRRPRSSERGSWCGG